MLISIGHQICDENLDARKPPSAPHMAGGFAHDFRNFIHIIAVSANRMKKYTQNTKMLKQVDLIIDVCHNASEFVDEMLRLSRSDQGGTREIRLNDEVKKGATLLAHTLPDSIQLEMDLADSLPPMFGNASQIGQIIINLINNAKDAMNGDGRIRITSRKTPLKEQDCQGHSDARPGDFVTLAISDTGPGISPHLIPAIFDPFVSTKNSGDNAGLGLTMARAIVKKHHGWIDVKSQIGQGACFTIYLPAVATNRDRKTD